MNLNKAMIIGNLTRDPEVRTTPSGQNVANITVATSIQWTDQSGQKQEKTEFHNVVFWRKLADIVAQYLKKGSKIYVEGRIQTRSWDDNNNVKRFRTEIIAENMIMLDRPGGAQRQGTSSEGEQPSPKEDFAQAEPKMEEINVEDIPF